MNRNGPRPPSRRRVEHQLQRHARSFTGHSPLPPDPHHQSPFTPLLRAHRDWWLASHLPHQPGQEAPLSWAVQMEASPSRSWARGRPGLPLLIAVASLGDLGTIFSAVSAMITMPLPVTALLVLTMATAGLFAAHEIGRELRLRRLGAARMPGVLVTLLAVIWLAVGLVAALSRFAAPPNSPSGITVTVTFDAAAVHVPLAGLVAVLYSASGLAAAALGFLTGDSGHQRAAWPGIAARLRERENRRHQVATARIDAYFRVLAADIALTLAATLHDPHRPQD